MEQRTEQRSSVEIGRSAAGDTTLVVKVYREPGEEADASVAAQILFDGLCIKYPLSAAQKAKLSGVK